MSHELSVSCRLAKVGPQLFVERGERKVGDRTIQLTKIDFRIFQISSAVSRYGLIPSPECRTLSYFPPRTG